MDRPINVVHMVQSLEVGGLERVVLDLARHAPQVGQRPAIVCVEGPGQLADEAREMGVSVHSIGKRAGVRPGAILQLRKLFRRLAADVVHTHHIGALLYAGPAARLAGVRAVIHSEHGKHFAARRRTQVVGRIASRFARIYTCVSSDIAQEVVAHRISKAAKVWVVGNGIDGSRFDDRSRGAAVRDRLNIPHSAKVIGTVGRLSEVKRQDLLIEAFALVRQEHPDVHLLLVGDGEEAERLQALAQRLEIDRWVHFAGYQPNPAPYLHAMDIFALTSRSEGMPLAVLEAWAAGVAVVASRVGGLPELIEPGQTGLLFDPNDAEKTARAVRHVLRHPDLASRLAAAGHERFEQRYSLKHMVQNYHRIYMELLGQPLDRTEAAYPVETSCAS